MKIMLESLSGGIWVVLVGAPVQRARSGDHIAFRATPEIVAATAAGAAKELGE